MILASAASGTFAGVVLFVFSHVAPMFGAGNFIRDLDKPRIFGAAVSRREAHVVGALTHILVSGASGAMFGFLVSVWLVASAHPSETAELERLMREGGSGAVISYWQKQGGQLPGSNAGIACLVNPTRSSVQNCGAAGGPSSKSR